jgi:hypothetical protein
MPATVRLRDIVDAVEMQFDEMPAFLDLDTGKVETVSSDLLHEVEEAPEDEQADPDEPPDEEWKTAKRIVLEFGVRYKRLPTRYEVHEWEILREFADSVESERIREELLDAVHGAGAFRNFKAAIRRRGIEQEWFAFRAEALKQIAIDWCEENGVVWE